MARPINPQLHPAFDDFDPLETAKHLAARILSFDNPHGLIAYWGQTLNKLRLKALPEDWRRELARRYEERVDALNDAGPY